MFNRVVLPLPFGPIRPWTSPGRSSIDTPDSAATPPKCLHRPRTDSAPVAVCGVMAPAPAATWRRSTVADRAPPAAHGGGRGGARPQRPAPRRRPWGGGGGGAGGGGGGRGGGGSTQAASALPMPLGMSSTAVSSSTLYSRLPSFANGAAISGSSV